MESNKIRKRKHSGNKKGRKSAEDAELQRLEKLVLGDGSNILDNIVTVEHVLGNDQQIPSPDSGIDMPYNSDEGVTQARKPAWEDADDDNIVVKDALQAQGHENMGLPGKATEKYHIVLKRKFEMKMGNPEWARLDCKRRKHNTDNESDDNEEDNEDNVLKHCGNFLERKSTTLVKGVIQIKKLQDLNKNSRKEGHYIKAVEFHPASTVALVAGNSGIASIFQVDGTSNPVLQSVKFEKFPIHCAKFSQDGCQFIVGSQWSHFYVYDMMEGRSVRVPSNQITEKTHMKKFEVSPDGRVIAVCGKYGNIHILHARTKEWITSLKMNGEVTAICFSNDGSLLYSHGDGGEVYIWDMNTRSCMHRFVDDGCLYGTSIAVAPSGQLLACGSKSGVVNLYDASTVSLKSTPQPLKILLNLTTPCTSLKFNPTSEILAMGSEEKENAVRLVHFPSMTVFSNFPSLRHSPVGHVQNMAFSPSSGYIAFGNRQTSAQLYRLKHFGNY